ncbi:hypothetical protein CLCR_10513 [Cladophialophora carrionii]|uniref:Protein kinase domain-containing protein n=1 Tax=Cladophialophora carrionii TaxID=86049 RepID=A0A1C1CW26_9EURO|nr:hypothetical protein CLCR_10513 [Cladophialophora carrionii]
MSGLDKRRTFWPGKERRENINQHVLKRSWTELNEKIETPRKIDIAHSTSRISLPVHIAKLDKSPWQDYVRLLNICRGGQITVAYSSSRSQKLVAISEIPNCSREQLRALRPALHENIVGFTAAYFLDPSIYLVYELMPVSLIGILNTPLGPLQVEEIATVCQSVFRGIHFVHEQLGVMIGDLTAETVLVARNGVVKLANIGKVALAGSEKTLRRDVDAAGLILVRMLEPDTGMLFPKLLQLQRPSSCDANARDLIAGLNLLSTEDILKLRFSKKKL